MPRRNILKAIDAVSEENLKKNHRFVFILAQKRLFTFQSAPFLLRTAHDQPARGTYCFVKAFESKADVNLLFDSRSGD